MDAAEEDDIVLDSEVPDVAVRLRSVGTRPPVPPIPRAPGFGDDEWAGQLADGRVLAFLREPVARCHLDRLLVVDGERRFERPLPPWVYYGQLLALGPRGLLIGGAKSAWRVERDGTMTTLYDEPDGETVHVCWLEDGTAVAAGWRTIILDGPNGRAALPCNRAVGAHVVGGDLLVISDDDGSQWILGGRVVARDWRPYRAAAGDIITSTSGDGYRVFVDRDVSAG